MALYDQSNESRTACNAANLVQAELHGVVARQAKGLSTNKYFKDHPDQLAAAQKEVARELTTFKPFSC